jgi:hypothetical protein
MKLIILFALLIQILNAQTLRRDNGREIVIDSQNQLMWMDTKDAIIIKKSQSDASDFCQKLSLGGLKGWRLPSIEEFKTIVDKNNHPVYIKKVFKYSMPMGYWSNNVKWGTLWFYADYMHFLSGTPYYDNKNKLKNVRCVRQY